MEMLFTETRRASRRSVLVDCQVVREDDFTLIGERALDLSPSGMLLSTNRSAQLGEELLVTLRVPGTRTWIDTTATVVRVIPARRQGDRTPALGLMFAPLAPEDARLLRTSLTPFPPTIPARTRKIDYAATAALIALG
ncbi:MAG: PilZ domain-containing protein [Polyangiaceae bacterium]